MELIFEMMIGVALIRPVWRSVEFRHVQPMVMGLVIGNVIGAYILANYDNEHLKLALSILVFILAIYLTYTSQRPLQFGISPKWGTLFGLAAGTLGGVFKMSGPIVVLYLVHQITNKESLRGTLIALFLLTDTWSALLYWYNGLFTLSMFETAFNLMPAFVVGIVLGYWSHFKISEKTFRIVIAIVLFLSGIFLIQGSP